MQPKLYGALAGWYALLTPVADYEEEARWFASRIRNHARREVATVLELGCGAGANASFLKRWFEIVVVDLAADMLRECARVNPELEQHQGDMLTFRIDRRFDAVFIHDAASYLTTREELAAAAKTAAIHLKPGGVALLCPDDVRENFTPGVESGGSDGPDGRGVRYLEWSIPGDDDDVILSDYVYMLRDKDGSVRVEHDRHVTGRLPKQAWLDALERAGLAATVIPFEHSEVEAGSHHVFVGVKGDI